MILYKTQSERRLTPVKNLFYAKVSLPDENGCMKWTAKLDKDGYGSFSSRRIGDFRAHRLAYELMVGEIPPGFDLDHVCRNRDCVAPDHLEPVTSAENTRRGKVLITHCVNGHAFDAENTYWHRGRRRCKTCNRNRARAWMRKYRYGKKDL